MQIACPPRSWSSWRSLVNELPANARVAARCRAARAVVFLTVNLVDELRAVTRALREAGVAYAVCGGIAVTIHGATRTTKDIDVLIAPSDLDRAVTAVRSIGFEYAALPMTFDAGTSRERNVRRISKLHEGEHMILDVIVADASLADALDDRVDVDLPDGRLTVVSRATLIRMKRLAGRAQDLADIEALERGRGE